MPSHVFISYVREDGAAVDRMQRMLEAAGISVWRDTRELWPGDDWRIRIRQAIQTESFVFLACFSNNSLSRETTYQREELLLAIEQFRLRRPNQPWLIPVRFNDCLLPPFDLGAGRTLDSLQRVDLFEDRWDEGSARLISGIQKVLSSGRNDRTSGPFDTEPNHTLYHENIDLSEAADERSYREFQVCGPGERLLTEERWSEALQAFRRCAQHDPDNARAWKSMWITSTRCDDRPAGLEATTGWTSIIRDDPLAWAVHARELTIAARFDESAKAAEHYLRLPGEGKSLKMNTMVLKDYGVALTLTGRLERVAEFIDRWPDTDDAFAATVKAKAFQRLGRHDEAVATTSRAAVLDPSALEAWWTQAVSLHEIGQHEQELKSVEKCIALAPDSAKVRQMYAVSLYETQQWQATVEVIDQGWPGSDSDPYAFTVQAKALQALKRHTDAVAVAAKALVLAKDEELFGTAKPKGPPPVGAWEVQAWSLHELGHFNGAAVAAQQLVRHNGENPYYWFLLQRALQGAKRYDELLDAAERRLELDPSPAAWSQKVVSLLSLKRYEEAVEGAELLLSLSPDDARALDLMATACMGANDPRALHYAERWLRTAPESTDARWTIETLRSGLDEVKERVEHAEPSGHKWFRKGEELLQRGRHYDAIAVGELLLSLCPDNPPTIGLMARARAGAGDPDALGHAKRWLEVDPQSPEARQLVEELQRAEHEGQPTVRTQTSS
jgi:tetratricopeptide (TPR) repeat protein